MCTDDHSLFGPADPGGPRGWRTPTGLLTADPPALLVGAGDIASCSASGDEATAKLLDSIPGTVFNVGDDVYENATSSDFKNCYDPTWGRHKARTKPSAGNHEYQSSGATPYFNYFGAAAGEPGKGYYSYDVGAWHVIALNSNISMSVGSTQEKWLKADLAANPRLCTLAYFHYPLYSSTSGSGSGGATMSEVRPLWDALYAAGADLIVSAHRHDYERQAPQRPDRTADAVYGIRHIIAGTGGVSHISPTNVSKNSEVRNGDTYGVLKLWLYSDSYAWKFVPIAGKSFTDSGSTACHGAPGSGAAVSASKSTVSASPASLTAGGGTSTVTVTVKDANGNPISGATVVLAATGSGNTLAQPSGTTNSSGVATGTLSSTVAETKTVTATANGTAITQAATVTVAPGAVSASQSAVAAAPASIAVGSGASTITVTAKDANGNPISGATVVLAATGSGNTLTQPGGTTNASGVATGTLASTVAEAKTVTATINGTAVAQPATVTVTAGAVSASQSTIGASPASLEAGSGTATITVTAKDAGGNPISGATVVLAATGSGNTLTQPGETTDASGIATGTLSSTVAEGKTVSATVNGTGLAQTAAVTVTPGPVSAARSTVAASPGTIPADSGVATITVTAKDASGNRISGATVVLSATGSANTLTQPGGTTDAGGAATGTLSSTVAELKTVTATINGTAVTQAATVTVTSAPVSASRSTVVAALASFTAGDAGSPIIVTVRDGGGNPISGATVVLAATGSANTLTQPAPTDANGVATGRLSSTVAESKTVSASADGTPLAQTAVVAVTPGPASGSQSTVTAAPPSITVESGTSTITVTARDAYGNAVSGATVALAATGSGNTLTQPAGPTGANGAAAGTLSSTVPETKTVSATVDGTALDQTATVSVAAASVSASQSTVSASPGSVTAGSGSSTITVAVRDDGGNPISGATVVLAATGSGNTLTQPSGATDASGLATGTLSSTVAGSKTVSATANGTALAQFAVVAVTAGSPSGSQSTLAASPATIPVGGTATITVTAQDGNGNPVSGANVVLAATGSGNTVTQPAGPTNESGLASGTLSSTVAEAKTVSATIDGVAVAQAATVTVTPSVSASLSKVVASPTAITAGSGTSTITVTVKDAAGNPVSGATVVLSATGTGNTVTEPVGPTDASGVAIGTLSSTVAASKTVSATANGIAITQTAKVTVSAGPVSASQSAVTAAPASIGAGSGASAITVTAKDAYGNPVGGASVTLSATGSGNTLTQPSAVTNASGIATGTFSSTVVESKTVSATANGIALAQTASVSVVDLSAAVVLVGAGEVARCEYANDEATAQVLDNIPGTVFTTGDNIHASGSLADFTACYDPSWGRHKARTRPSVGPDEYQTAGASGYFDYFGAAAGDRDKGYYSYDVGEWHVVVLNSNIAMSAGSAQEQWLRADLAASGKRCALAYWEHPRFSSYGTSVRSAVKPLWDALYAAGVEVVVNGYYRLYERFAPQRPDEVADPQSGIRQFTVGTGGHGTESFGSTSRPNSEVRGSGAYGVLKLTLASGGYSWEFVPVPGGNFTDSGSGTCH